jgi:hypothetical protein
MRRVIAYNKTSAQGATTHRIHRQRLIILRSIDYHLLKVTMVKGVLSRVNPEHILPVEINHQQSPRDWIERAHHAESSLRSVEIKTPSHLFYKRLDPNRRRLVSDSFQRRPRCAWDTNTDRVFVVRDGHARPSLAWLRQNVTKAM